MVAWEQTKKIRPSLVHTYPGVTIINSFTRVFILFCLRSRRSMEKEQSPHVESETELERPSLDL